MAEFLCALDCIDNNEDRKRMVQGQGSRLIKNSIFTLFNTLFMMASSWIISIWVARSLGPSNYGIFNLVLWLSGTMSWVIGMGFTNAVTRFIAEYKGRGETACLRGIIHFILKIEIGITIFTTVLLLFFNTRIADFFFSPEQSFFFFLAALGLLPGILTAILSAAIEGIQKFEYFTYSNLLLTPLSFAAKIVVLQMGKGISGLLVVMLVFSFINALFYYIVLKREGTLTQGSSSLSKEVKKRILSYNKSLIAILTCDKIVWDKSENFFLGRLCNAVEIGYYNLGYNVAQKFTSILPTTFWRVLFPAMSTYFGSGDEAKMKRLFYLSTRYLAYVSFPIGIGGMILAYQIIHFLYGYEYIGAQRVLQIIFVASVFSSLSNPASAVLYSFEKQSFIYKYGIVLAIINISMDIFLIKFHGAKGAAICYGITTVLASVGGLIYTCKTMKLRYPFRAILKTMLATVIMAVVMELIIIKNKELFGFIAAVVSGAITYIVSLLVFETFEEEDLVLFMHIRKVLPGKTKGIVDFLYQFLLNFKNLDVQKDRGSERLQ